MLVAAVVVAVVVAAVVVVVLLAAVVAAEVAAGCAFCAGRARRSGKLFDPPCGFQGGSKSFPRSVRSRDVLLRH